MKQVLDALVEICCGLLQLVQLEQEDGLADVGSSLDEGTAVHLLALEAQERLDGGVDLPDHLLRQFDLFLVL